MRPRYRRWLKIAANTLLVLVLAITALGFVVQQVDPRPRARVPLVHDLVDVMDGISNDLRIRAGSPTLEPRTPPPPTPGT